MRFLAGLLKHTRMPADSGVSSPQTDAMGLRASGETSNDGEEQGDHYP